MAAALAALLAAAVAGAAAGGEGNGAGALTAGEAMNIFRDELTQGAAWLRLGRPEDLSRARGALQSARRHHLSSPEPRYWLALLEMTQQALPRAREQANDAVELAGDGTRFPEAYLLRGQLSLQAQDYQRALEDLSRAEKCLAPRAGAVPPDRALTLTRFNLGRLHYHRSAARNADPAVRAADLERAAALFKEVDDQLLALTRISPELGPTWVEGLLYRGWCAYGQKDYFAAEAFFRRADEAAAAAAATSPELGDKRIEALFWLGLCERHNRRPVEALTRLGEASRLIDDWQRRHPRRRHPLYADTLLQVATLCFQPETYNREEGLRWLRLFAESTQTHPELAPVKEFLRQQPAE